MSMHIDVDINMSRLQYQRASLLPLCAFSLFQPALRPRRSSPSKLQCGFGDCCEPGGRLPTRPPSALMVA